MLVLSTMDLFVRAKEVVSNYAVHILILKGIVLNQTIENVRNDWTGRIWVSRPKIVGQYYITIYT